MGPFKEASVKMFDFDFYFSLPFFTVGSLLMYLEFYNKGA
jgi:hypothetical protein